MGLYLSSFDFFMVMYGFFVSGLAKQPILPFVTKGQMDNSIRLIANQVRWAMNQPSIRGGVRLARRNADRGS